MPDLGPDICYSCQDFLTLVAEGDLSLSNFSTKQEKVLHVTAEQAIAICQECNWISFDPRGRIILTDTGKEIMSLLARKEVTLALRVQIFSMVRTYNWSWTEALRHGREESLRRMPDDARQCFRECKALGVRWSKAMIAWWDNLAKQQRGLRADKNLEVGRRAEELSVEYERRRTGKRPDWRALETTFDGYDILSQVSKTDKTPLRIEVKGTSRKISNADFFVSRHEWRTAKASGNYVFHLWAVGPPNTLSVVNFSKIEPHSPADRNKGQWDSFHLRFGIFFAQSSGNEVLG